MRRQVVSEATRGQTLLTSAPLAYAELAAELSLPTPQAARSPSSVAAARARLADLAAELERASQELRGELVAAAAAATAAAAAATAAAATAAAGGSTLTGALPTGALPTGALPTGALPTGALPTGTLPTGALPRGWRRSSALLAARPSRSPSGSRAPTACTRRRRTSCPATRMRSTGSASMLSGCASRRSRRCLQWRSSRGTSPCPVPSSRATTCRSAPTWRGAIELQLVYIVRKDKSAYFGLSFRRKRNATRKGTVGGQARPEIAHHRPTSSACAVSLLTVRAE